MDESKASNTFLLSANGFGQKVYASQIHQINPSQSFIIDEHGNMIEYQQEDAVTLSLQEQDEVPETQREEQKTITLNNSVINQLEDPNHLGFINALNGDFELNLMNKLDSVMTNIVTDPESYYLTQHINIQEPLSKLKELIEQKLNIELKDYEFCLQGSQLLKADKNLAGQCVQGEGLVQVSIQIQTHLKRINIIDVLKPAEDYVPGDELEESNIELEKSDNSDSVVEVVEKTKGLVQWQVDYGYKKEQDRLKIPTDPHEWTVLHVRHWIQWAVRQFNLTNIKLSDWSMTGEDLYKLTLPDFQKIVPNDTGDVFWTHFELLRKMKIVAVMRRNDASEEPLVKPKVIKPNKVTRVLCHYPTTVKYFDSNSNNVANRSGNNGQIQLWQFLLELLTTKEYRSIIRWVGSDGEFKLINPQIVAQLWGERKNKPKMNYEKLSRALRYYYDGDMICKVSGKRFVYQFVCDLKQMLGYSADELSQLVNFASPFARVNNN